MLCGCPEAAIDILSQVLGVIDLESHAASRSAVTAAAPVRYNRHGSRAHILLRGTVQYQPHGSDAGLTLLAGDMLLLTRRSRHNLVPGPAAGKSRVDAVWLTIDFHLDRLSPHPLAVQLPEELLLRAEQVTDHAELLRTAELLETELINHQPGEQFIALRLADVAVVAALRRYQQRPDAGSGFLSALSDPATRRALAAIHAEPARRWQLEDLAQRAGLSVGTFGERFHRLVGEPPMGYVRLWRLLTARRLIATTPLTIRRIAQRIGYRSPGGFSRAFRRQFGSAPSSLRRGR